MKEAMKTLLLEGHYISLHSNYRISPNGDWIEVKDYLHGRITERFEKNRIDTAIDRYLALCQQ